MSSAIPIASAGRTHADLSVPSSSPVTASPIKSHVQSNLAALRPKVLKPFAVTELKLLLLENISDEAVQTFKKNGFQVDHFAKAWSEDELVEKIGEYHAIGIRSKTKITERVLQAAPHVCDRHFYRQSSTSLIILRHFYYTVTRRWLLLHRDQSGRSIGGSTSWYTCIQLSLLQLALRRRTGHGRSRWTCTTTIRSS